MTRDDFATAVALLMLAGVVMILIVQGLYAK